MSETASDATHKTMQSGGRVKCLLTAVFSLLIMAAFNVRAGTLNTMEVPCTGNGPSLQQSIDSCLQTAIQEVNGTTMAQTSVFVSMRASAETKNSAAYLTSVGYLVAVEKATQGAVKGFKIISYHRNPDGSWLVNLDVSVAGFSRSAEEKRTSIVVTIPHAQKRSYQIFGLIATSRTVASKLADQVQTFLVSTNKFTVLDRNHDEDLNRELDIAESSQASTGQFAMIGQKIAAQFLLVNSIEYLNYHEIHTRSKTGDHVYTQPIGGMRVRYQLIDTSTQQVVLSKSASVDLADLGITNGISGYRVIADSISLISKEEGAAVLHHLFPIRIIAYDNGYYIIDTGEDVLTVGETYKVMSYGPKVIDPDTHESLGRIENYCCEIRIRRIAPKISYGKLLPPNKTLTSFSSEKYILGSQVTGSKARHSRASSNAMKALEEEIKKQQQSANGNGNG